MDMSDVTVPAPKTTLKFMGWSLTPGTDASEDTGDTVGSRPLLNNGVVEFEEDTDVYPVFYSGLWIVFVSAGTGMGASYVEPYFLTADSENASAAEPDDPTMRGYAFDGWVYNVPDTDYVEAETSGFFDFTQSFEQLSNLLNDNGEVVLYGHWKGGNTSYVVAYWYQDVDNDKTLTDHSKKTYSYGGQTEPITTVNGRAVTTGMTLTPRTEDTNTAKAGVGFTYANYYDDSVGNTTVTAAEDGSTILNVYFDRDLITMRFYKTAGSYSDGGWGSSAGYTPPVAYNSQNWTNDRYADTYTGLYGQNWTQAGYDNDWPSPGSGYVWRYYSDEYTGGTNRQSGTVFPGITILGQFKLDLDTYDSTKKEIRIFKVQRNDLRNVYFYQQNTDGSTYPTSTNISAVAVNGATFSFTDKYVGFKIVGYRLGNSASGTYTPVNSTTNADGSHNYSPASVTLNNNLHIRLEREKYKIKFLNPLNNSELLTEKELPYEAPLSGAKPTAAETANIDLGQAGYEWDGFWYLDQACTVLALFGSNIASELGDAYVEHNETDHTVVVSTDSGNVTYKYTVLGGMPLKGTKVYAGKKMLHFYIKIDPNGGQLMTGQATWRWVTYGDKTTYTYDNIERNYIEYKGTGTPYYYYYDEFETDRSDDIWHYRYMSINPRTAYYTSNTVPNDWVQTFSDGSTVAHSGSEAQAWLDTETQYSYEKDAYGLIGWYDITDGVENMKPFKSYTEITRNTIIQAQWRRTGEYQVRYSVDAVDEDGNALVYPEGSEQAGDRVVGANSPVDGAKYADQSDSAILDKMGVIPSGYNFVGWYYNGNVYQPGDVFQILARLSDDKSLIWIYPVLEPVEVLPVEVIHITFDPNGGVFTTAADTEISNIIASVTADEAGSYAPEFVKNEDGTYSINNLKINEGLSLLSAAAVERGVIVDNEMVPGRGYRLKEWNTKADGTGTSFPLDTIVGVDDKTPVDNTVYAIWEELFYIYHTATGKFQTVVKGDTTDRWAFTTGFKKDGTVNLTQYTSHYYGGFAVYAAGNAAAAGLEFEGGDVKTGCSIADSYWTRYKAARTAEKWNPGDTGAVYYLKEVPTSYLAKPVAVTIRDDYGKGDVVSLHFLSVTDTSIYREGGIKLNNSDILGAFSQSFTLTQNNSDTAPTTITADSQFKLPGYLTVVYGGGDEGTTVVDEYTGCQAYWTTYDNVKVYGIQQNIRDIDISLN